MTGLVFLGFFCRNMCK